MSNSRCAFSASYPSSPCTCSGQHTQVDSGHLTQLEVHIISHVSIQVISHHVRCIDSGYVSIQVVSHRKKVFSVRSAFIASYPSSPCA